MLPAESTCHSVSQYDWLQVGTLINEPQNVPLHLCAFHTHNSIGDVAVLLKCCIAFAYESIFSKTEVNIIAHIFQLPVQMNRCNVYFVCVKIRDFSLMTW